MDMYITIKEVMELPIMARSVLLSGQAQADTKVTSANIVSTPDIIPFVKKGDFIITSIHPIKDKLREGRLIHELIAKGAAALAISPDESFAIPQELVDIALTANFPLIQLPTDISFFEILTPVVKTLLSRKDNYEKCKRGAKIIKAISRGKVVTSKQLGIILQEQDIKLPDTFVVVIVTSDGLINIDASLEIDSIYRIAEDLGAKGSIVYDIDIGALVLMPMLNIEKYHTNFHKILKKYTQTYPNSCIGISNPMQDIFNINNAIQQAKQAIAVSKNLQGFGNIVDFDSLGVYKVMSIVSEQDLYIKKEFVKEKLSPIVEYDRANKTDIVLTIKTFFECGSNLRQTAKKLNVHYNTISNRLKIVEDTTGTSLSDIESALELNLAIKLMGLL